MTGNDLRNAQQSLDEFNRPAVHFTLKQDAAVRFGSFTEANIGRPMAIILDDRVMSVATIQGRITDSGQITGITREEMLDQVITLKSGALAGVDGLPRRADRRALAWCRLHSCRSHGFARRPGCSSSCSCSSTTS